MKRLSIRDTSIGRGVFAEEPIRAGEVVCSDPVVEIPDAEMARLKSTRLRDYYWDWPGGAAVVFGAGSMMNHFYGSANTGYRPDPEARRMVFTALADIPAGKEIRIDYGRTFPPEWSPECRPTPS